MQVPPSLEGAKLVEQRLLEKDSEKVLSLFITLHSVCVLTIFVFFKLIFVSTFLDVHTFNSQANVEMDVHESKLVPQTTFTHVLGSSSKQGFGALKKESPTKKKMGGGEGGGGVGGREETNFGVCIKDVRQ